MVLVFILFTIFIFLLLLVTIFILSTIKIEIKNFKIANKEKSKINEIDKVNETNRIKDKYEIKVGLYFLKKIPILWIKLDNKKIKQISNSNKLKEINLKKIENKIPNSREIIAIIKNSIKLNKLKLRIDLGTEDAILTSYIIAFIASIIGVILPHIIENDNMEKYSYIVNPIYQNRNEYHISIDSIISIKIVHIIYSMLNFTKKGREKYERTSNRRSYAYRYE